MKNLKVKNKLRLSFGIVVFLTLVISFLALSGMTHLKKQSDILSSKTLTNTEYVWNIRRDILSENRYYLLAITESKNGNAQKYINDAQKEFEHAEKILEKFKNNYRVDKSKVDSLEDMLSKQSSNKERIVDLINKGTPESLTKAYQIFYNDYHNLFEEQSALLDDITNDQFALSQTQIEKINSVYHIIFAVVICALVLSLIISLFMISKLLKAIIPPLTEIEDAASALAKGDFSVNISYESKDEFGITCESLQESFTELKRVIQCTAYSLSEIANGNFSFDPNMNFQGEMKQIEIAGGILLSKMTEFFSEIQSSANQIQAGADQVSSGAQSLAQGATEQASSIQELSATISEISGNVSDNARNSRKANDLATISGDVAKATFENMGEMLSAMNQISASAENIGKVIKVIDDITFQTNILSLNAAVEAARAGVAGKGFAVVADEVRNLAQKSSDSAKEITSLIESAILSVNQGEAIAKKTSEAFNSLTEKIQDVISTVNEIANASEEQASSIQQINIGVEQISSVVQTNSATSEESAAASEELSSHATILNSLVAQFRVSNDVDNLTVNKTVNTNTTNTNFNPISKDLHSFEKY